MVIPALVDGMRWLFEGLRGGPEDDESAAALSAHYAPASEKMGLELLPPEHQLDQFGWALMHWEGDAITARDIFQLNLDLRPESGNAYRSLGYAHFKLFEMERAYELWFEGKRLRPDLFEND